MTPVLSSSAVIMDMTHTYQFVNTLAQCYEANAQLQGGAVPGGEICQPYQRPFKRYIIQLDGWDQNSKFEALLGLHLQNRGSEASNMGISQLVRKREPYRVMTMETME